jgi:hypothetical protein
MTRLVLLVVDPYLIHAYWEVVPEKLHEAQEQAGQAKGVLRFYRWSKTAGEDALPDSFDIEVDLQSRNWYAHLWSPEESLYADLALKKADGTLIRLVRSQVVHVPRTRPAIAIEQRFMKVAATERRAEIVPAPPAEHDRPQEGMAPLPAELNVRHIVKPTGPALIVRKELEDAYPPVQSPRSRFELEPMRAVEIFTPPHGRSTTDLIAIAERSLATGLSSGTLQKSPLEGERKTGR